MSTTSESATPAAPTPDPNAAATPPEGTTPEPTPAPTPSTEPWTPYTPDPTKTAQENLQLKEAYDAKAPAGQDPNVPGAAAPKQEEKKEGEPAPTPLTLEMLKAPEGFELDPTLGTEFMALLNTEKDPVKLAQGLIELSAKANTLASEKGSQEFDAVQDNWKKATKEDPEIGGANYDKNLASTKAVIDRFGGPKLQEAIELTGIGNHPEFVRLMTKIAPMVLEAAPVTPSTPTPPASRYSSTNLYPDTK